ncbi:Pr6Pr family membrane protein [Lacisediminihabitans sp.]|jgi:hypothetical protein|uniref:Pr6Pr family membrane protein n=1 Tax=Lacisediminihabitans sp. TaxID=2787631 RepID=UPI002F9540FF
MTTVSDSPLRRSFGALRLVLGLLVLSAIITQITDELLHDAFKPGEYFAYFTIESSMINVVVLLVGGMLALRGRAETEFFTSVRVAVLSYAVITAAVYNVLLRNIPSTGYHGVQWPNEVMHVWVPIVIVLDWLFAPGRARVGWTRLWLVVSYPLAWLAFTMLRGAVTGWYPYPFLEPDGPGGILSVLVYVVGISVFILAVASTVIVVGRLDARRPRLVLADSEAADSEPF